MNVLPKLYHGVIGGAHRNFQGPFFTRSSACSPGASSGPTSTPWPASPLSLAWLLERRSTGLGPVFGWRLQPHTGRSHQLRYDLARHECPIFGDMLYGATIPWPQGGIALRAVSLSLAEVPADRRLGLPERLELAGLPLP